MATLPSLKGFVTVCVTMACFLIVFTLKITVTALHNDVRWLLCVQYYTMTVNVSFSHLTPVALVFLPSRVNVDIQNQCVSPAGIFNNDIDPDKLPAKLLLVVSITEVSLLHQFSVVGTK